MSLPSNWQENIQELFNELEAEYKTSASLVFSKTGSCLFFPSKNQIHICPDKKDTLKTLRWTLGHEFGHAVDYKNQKEYVNVLLREFNKRFIIVSIAFISTLIVSFLTSKFITSLIAISFPFIIFKLILPKKLIKHKRESEIFSDNFANVHIGGGANIFPDTTWRRVEEKMESILLVTFHPPCHKRKAECLNYPAKEKLFFPNKIA